ncbi:SUMF1/EgtB/PvdO family nonheme iron enzyme [bacterium]|nr:SUMF1/EgtB/PvdO family nonheme iron enzyme [bacterium]
MNKSTWQARIRERLQTSGDWLQQMTPGVTYGALSAATIMPLLTAAQQGDWAVMGTLFGIVGSLGTNLVSNQVQAWFNRSEAEIAREIDQYAADPAWRAELDALNRALETPRVVQAILGEAEWDRFRRLLQDELAKLGNLERYEIYLTEIHTNGGAHIEGDADIKGDFVNRDKITHIYHVYQSAPGQPILDEAGFTAAVSRYLSWVRNRYGQLNLRGVQRRERQALTLTLEDVYVSLQAMVTPKRNERRRAKKSEMLEEQAETQTVDMAQLLALGERLAIIGGPGSGKTTFLHIIASALAHALLTDEVADVQRYLGLEKELPLPIFVTLSDYNRYRRQCENTANHDPRQGTLTAFISHSLIRQEAALGLPADFFERLLGQGKRCIVLLDGLDEVADERERMLVRQAVENLAANQGVGQMLVTSRTRAFQGRSMLSEEFRVAQVQAMTLEQAQALAGRWCEAVYDETRAAEQSVRLQDAIASLEAMRERRGESPLVDSPLLVTIVAIVHYNDRRLPDERADLYTRCVDVLLAESYKPESQATFDLVDWGGNEREKRSLLAYLAFCMMSAGETSGRSVDETQIRRWLRSGFARLNGEDKADAALDIFLQAMSERGSLIDERGGRYQFIHLTFQEFLCAAYLVDTLRENAKIVAKLFEDGRIAQSWWRETVLLTVGYMGLESIDAPLTLVHALANHNADPVTVVAAVEVSTVAFLEQNGQDDVTKSMLRARLVNLIQDKTHPGSPEQRLATGKALSRLGDPRPGVGVRSDGLPDIDWVKIPEVDEQGRFDFLYGEKGERRSEPTFWMARYPVTYAQFQAFVDAEDGIQHESWFHRLDRTQNSAYDQRFQIWNHPRENVTWYQAIAFCRWLTAKAKTEPEILPPEAHSGGWRITLPTEWQWEKAARGHDGRTYPWGNEYISGYANVDETEKKNGPHKLGQTSAVGLYPQGVSPYGILDLSGNVWEWCRNEYNNPDRIQDEGGNNRAFRGCSWYQNADRARASARYVRAPYSWDYDYGFRLVVVPITRA